MKLLVTGAAGFIGSTYARLVASEHEVTVVRDQVGSPTYTAHLAEGIVRLIATDAYGVHHMAAGGHCSWYDFAVAIFDRTKLSCQVIPARTDELGRPAPRPEYSVLETERDHAVHLPDWRAGLDDYLAER